MVVDGEVLSAPFLAPTVGPDGLEPDSVVITVGATDEAQQMAVDLAATLQR
jgi:ribosomal protein L11